jgi:hypothetical protein
MSLLLECLIRTAEGRTKRSRGSVQAKRSGILIFVCVVLLLSSSGCSVAPDGSDEEDVQLTAFYTPLRQPDLSSKDPRVTAWSTSYDGVIRRYDSLRADHPAYITKRTLGMATDRTPLHAYYFAPESHENTILVTAGLHGNERLAVWALFLFLRHLSDEGRELPALTDLRTNTRLVVVPVANPTGFTDITRQNRNGVDLNRNFDYRWEEYRPREDSAFGYDYKGDRPHSEAATRLLVQLFRDHASATAYLDLHNFGERDRHWPWYLPKDGPNDATIYRQVVEHFGREEDTVFSLKTTRPTSYSFVASTLGVHASTPEFSLALFGNERYDSADVTAAVRWYGNLILGHAKM